MTTYSLFYVLNGLFNGERGTTATRAGTAERMLDGHYYLLDDGEDPDGFGPYDCREDAEDEAKRAVAALDRVQTWVFDHPSDASPRRVMDEDSMTLVGDLAVINHDTTTDTFTCTLEGSYETIVLTISCKTHGQAALVFNETLKAHATFVMS